MTAITYLEHSHAPDAVISDTLLEFYLRCRIRNASDLLTMNWPKISLVTPSFNQAPYLEMTLLSVLEQGYPNLEFIVLDGGSTDGSVDIIRKYESQLALWRSKPDDGQYSAVLEGFSRSTGEILGWINSDDRLLPHSLQTVASIFLNHPETEWITGLPTVIDVYGTATVPDEAPLWCRGLFLNKHYKFIQQESTFWRRSLWEKAGATLRTESTLAGDLELWVRFFRHAVLQSVRYHFGAFRQQPDQKTAHRLEAYCSEAEAILDQELEFYRASGAPPLRMAPPLLSLKPSDIRSIASVKPLESHAEDLLAALTLGDFNQAAVFTNSISSAMPECFAALQLQAVCESFRGDSIGGEAIVKNASLRFRGDTPQRTNVPVPPFLQACIDAAIDAIAPVPLSEKIHVNDGLRSRGGLVEVSRCAEQNSPCIESGGAAPDVPGGEGLLVTAIVSTYNSERLIGPCLDDLVSQSLFQRGQLEVIVVDSGSEQNEKQVVETYRERFRNIIYFRTERESIYAAWNRAIRVSRGKFVTNANTDDTHREDALEKLAAALLQHPDADLAYGDFINTSVPNDSFANPKIIREVRLPRYEPATVLFYSVTGCHPMWRRSLFGKMGLFDPRYPSVGDYEFLLRFVRAGRCAVHVPEVLSLFCENQQGIQFKTATRNYLQFENVRDQYRAVMPIERVFEVDLEDKASMALAWVGLGNMAMEHDIPWFDEPRSDFDFAEYCYEAALKLDSGNEAALRNLLALKSRFGKKYGNDALFANIPSATARSSTSSLKKVQLGLVAVATMPTGQPCTIGLSTSSAPSAATSVETGASKSVPSGVHLVLGSKGEGKTSEADPRIRRENGFSET